jgi:hypothetical protein
VSVAPDITVALESRFVRDVPEMGVRWQAEAFPELTLLVSSTSHWPASLASTPAGCAARTGCGSWWAPWFPAALRR